ncbi:MAG: protein kinase [Myxococcales bacterium]|nr:protein kinase [Myxococcales bacterium]MCB9544984.1 protein kinase [Myxococcales bacterium]
MESLIDSRLGEYVIARQIATGGMASVFEATHHRTGEAVAIKVLAPDLRDAGEPLARILQEGRVITGLLHEHIVRVLDHGTADENIGFVVMELLQGESLRDVLDQERALDPQRAVFIARQVCAGLIAAHARDVFHRDIKPANIMLAEGQRHRDFVKLLDFGIAKLRRDDPARLAATAKGMTLGTPQYMSPEQATGEPIDARSDLYQVGLLIYEMLVGEPPFLHPNPVSCMAMQLSAKPRPIRERRPSVPEELEAVVLRCLEKRPRDRFESAEALADALDRLAMRITLREGARVKVDGAGSITGSLHLPTLGNPADRARFASNLADVLAQLWPEGDVPGDLLALRAPIAGLEEEQARIGVELAEAQAQTAALARGVEERLRPLERAIDALQIELARLRQGADAAAADERRHRGRVQAIDAEYARLYEEIEGHQRTLYAADEARTRMVDFRDLFREDIAARLGDLEAVFSRRAELTAALEATREIQARTMRQMADLELQLCELRRSALAVESERVTALASQQLAQTRLEGRHRALERALEHHHLRLGLAFRHAVSDLLARRSGEASQVTPRRRRRET